MNPPMIHQARVPRKQRRVVVTAASTRPRVADPLPRHENRPRRDCSRDQPGSMPSGYKPMIGFDWLRIRGVDTNTARPFQDRLMVCSQVDAGSRH